MVGLAWVIVNSMLLATGSVLVTGSSVVTWWTKSFCLVRIDTKCQFYLELLLTLLFHWNLWYNLDKHQIMICVETKEILKSKSTHRMTDYRSETFAHVGYLYRRRRYFHSYQSSVIEDFAIDYLQILLLNNQINSGIHLVQIRRCGRYQYQQ